MPARVYCTRFATRSTVAKIHKREAYFWLTSAPDCVKLCDHYVSSTGPPKFIFSEEELK